jgi:hypothetical protein
MMPSDGPSAAHASIHRIPNRDAHWVRYPGWLDRLDAVAVCTPFKRFIAFVGLRTGILCPRAGRAGL